MSDRMQTMQHLYLLKMGIRKIQSSKPEVTITQSFLMEVGNDQAASVFQTANARLLLKAKNQN